MGFQLRQQILPRLQLVCFCAKTTGNIDQGRFIVDFQHHLDHFFPLYMGNTVTVCDVLLHQHCLNFEQDNSNQNSMASKYSVFLRCNEPSDQL